MISDSLIYRIGAAKPKALGFRGSIRAMICLLQTAVTILKEHRRKTWVLVLVVACGVIFGISPNDQKWLEALSSGNGSKSSPSQVAELARLLSFWGDFLGFNIVIALGISVLAYIRRSAHLRNIVIISILGSCLSGGVANVLRSATGRVRPDSRSYAPGFYGPTLRSQMHSFPSGHTATAFGSSIPVAIAAPPVGVPLVIAAAGIGWSRLFNRKHHPSDIAVSIALAVLVGVPLGCAVRRLRVNLAREPEVGR